MPTNIAIPLDGITILNPDEATAFLNEHPHTLGSTWSHRSGMLYRHVALNDKQQTMPARALPPLPDGVRIVILEDGKDEQEIKAHRKTFKALKQAGYTTARHLFVCDESFQSVILDHGSIGQTARRTTNRLFGISQPGQFVAFIAVNEALAKSSWAGAYGYDQLLEAAWEHADARRRGGVAPWSRTVVLLASGHIAYGFANHADFNIALPHVVAACKQPATEAMTVDQARTQAKAIITSLADDIATFASNMDEKTMRLNQTLAQLYHLTGDEYHPFVTTNRDGIEHTQSVEGVLDEALHALTINPQAQGTLRDMIATNLI